MGHASFASPVAIICNRGNCGRAVFAALRGFRSSSFFGSRRCFCVCVPRRGLACRVVSTFGCSSQRVVGSFGFCSRGSLTGFRTRVAGPSSTLGGIHAGLSAAVSGSDGVIMLSAYVAGRGDGEFLIYKMLMGSRGAG